MSQTSEKLGNCKRPGEVGNRIPKGSVMVNQLQYEDVVDYADQIARFF